MKRTTFIGASTAALAVAAIPLSVVAQSELPLILGTGAHKWANTLSAKILTHDPFHKSEVLARYENGAWPRRTMLMDNCIKKFAESKSRYGYYQDGSFLVHLKDQQNPDDSLIQLLDTAVIPPKLIRAGSDDYETLFREVVDCPRALNPNPHQCPDYECYCRKHTCSYICGHKSIIINPKLLEQKRFDFLTIKPREKRNDAVALFQGVTNEAPVYAHNDIDINHVYFVGPWAGLMPVTTNGAYGMLIGNPEFIFKLVL